MFQSYYNIIERGGTDCFHTRGGLKMGYRYGVVVVSGVMVREEIDIVADIFAKLKAVVLRCEYKYAEDSFEYVVYSHLFEEIEVGVKAPLYKLIIGQTYNDEGEVIDRDVTVSVEPYSTGKVIPDSLVMPQPIRKMEVFKD